MTLVLFDGVAVSNMGAEPVLVIDPRYYIKAQPEVHTVHARSVTRVIKAQPETRNIKG